MTICYNSPLNTKMHVKIRVFYQNKKFMLNIKYTLLYTLVSNSKQLYYKSI